MKSPLKYKRTVLFQNKDVEIILIDWGPKSQTPFHDHGKSHGLIRILEGSLTEEFFLPYSYSNVHKNGNTVIEFPGTIHRMKNTGKTIARSLHIYTPPLVMREYKELGGEK